MRTATTSSVTSIRSPWVKRAALLSAVMISAFLLALLGPTIQQVRLTQACAKLGGQLEQSTEDVEPLVIGRTVYRCYGPERRLLDEW